MQELRFKNLLVAIDGSPGADLALAAAISAAQRDRARITLLTVVPDVVAETTRWGSPTLPSGDLQGDADRVGDRTLRAAAAEVPDELPVTLQLRHGKAAHEIVAQARAHDYDAILMGARGRGRVGSLMGSVSQEVLHHAPTRVFVAHEAGAAAA